MADQSDFSVDGWDEFTKAFASLIDKWEEKKIILLKRIGNIMEEEIAPNIPLAFASFTYLALPPALRYLNGKNLLCCT